MTTQIRSTKFATDPVVHHPTRLAIMVHLVRQGGRDRFRTVGMMLGTQMIQSAQSLSLHCKALDDAGSIISENVYIARAQPRTWLELTPAGYAALARYRDAILNMFVEPIAEPAAQLTTSIDFTEVNATQ